MLSRRRVIATGLATLGLGAVPVAAQDGVESAVLPEELMPREGRMRGVFPPGEIHVAPDDFALYWTLPGNRAIRYAVGIGREGLYEPGEFYVGAKKEWPSWTPTDDMIAREPEKYAQHAGGMPGGLDNPLGARALYLFTPERGDTFLRIHGTNKPETIGRAVSNGCARLVNEQMIELYDMVPLDTRVVLYRQSTLY
ncbi:MAG: L,D-transpeptidase [bacterium]